MSDEIKKVYQKLEEVIINPLSYYLKTVMDKKLKSLDSFSHWLADICEVV